MIDDDPGTPGDGHWEINTAWTDQRTPGSTLMGLPVLDANYGLGDRIQLNYQSSWNIARTAGAPTESGLADTQLAVKWRFYDEGDAGLQLSMFPRLTFPNPGSDSDRRGTADPGTSFFMPFETRKVYGPVAVNFNLGYTFSGERSLRGWSGGVCLGHDVMKGWEVDAEVHADASDGLRRSEVILNLGTRVDLSPHTTLLLAIGRDTHDTLGRATSLLTYVGIQLTR